MNGADLGLCEQMCLNLNNKLCTVNSNISSKSFQNPSMSGVSLSPKHIPCKIPSLTKFIVAGDTFPLPTLEYPNPCLSYPTRVRPYCY